jgi:hypothetical protein
VAFATLLSHDKERIDACYDGEQLWYLRWRTFLATSQ